MKHGNITAPTLGSGDEVVIHGSGYAHNCQQDCEFRMERKKNLNQIKLGPGTAVTPPDH